MLHQRSRDLSRGPQPPLHRDSSDGWDVVAGSVGMIGALVGRKTAAQAATGPGHSTVTISPAAFRGSWRASLRTVR